MEFSIIFNYYNSHKYKLYILHIEYCRLLTGTVIYTNDHLISHRVESIVFYKVDGNNRKCLKLYRRQLHHS